MTTRRDFLTSTATTLLGFGAVVGLIACGGDDDGPEGAGGGGSSACNNSISANHGHEIAVPQADIDAAVERTYSIQGSSGHTHEITLTAADFEALAVDGEVTVTSTSDGSHTHDVTVTC